MASQSTKDPLNNYASTRPNDPGVDLVQVVIDWYRGHRNTFSSTEATNIGTAITNVLNGTSKV